MKEKFVILKADPLFVQKLDKIITERVKKDVDTRPISRRRGTKALARMSLWPEIEKIFVNAEIEDDRYKHG